MSRALKAVRISPALLPSHQQMFRGDRPWHCSGSVQPRAMRGCWVSWVQQSAASRYMWMWMYRHIHEPSGHLQAPHSALFPAWASEPLHEVKPLVSPQLPGHSIYSLDSPAWRSLVAKADTHTLTHAPLGPPPASATETHTHTNRHKWFFMRKQRQTALARCRAGPDNTVTRNLCIQPPSFNFYYFCFPCLFLPKISWSLSFPTLGSFPTLKHPVSHIQSQDAPPCTP